MRRRSLWAALLSAVIALGPAVPAWAQTVVIEVSAPGAVDVGAEVAVMVHLSKSDGSPIVRSPVTLTAESSFAGATGRYEVTGGITDDEGNAKLVYTQRAQDNGEMRLEYAGLDGVEFTAFSVGVEPGAQTYRSRAGIDIPILGGGWIVGLLLILWSLVAFAVSRVVVASRVGGPSVPRAARVFPVAVLTGVIVVGSVLLLVLVRSPNTHANLTGPGDFDRAPLADVVVASAFEGPSNVLLSSNSTGEEHFVQAECMGCHGIAGRGATVGGDLLGELREFDEFLDKVRRGPKGMPAFEPSALSDEAVREVFDYLVAANP